jgi:hypothetical protein
LKKRKRERRSPEVFGDWHRKNRANTTNGDRYFLAYAMHISYMHAEKGHPRNARMAQGKIWREVEEHCRQAGLPGIIIP